jgi:uroporphyrinogen decarboxylase
MKIQDNFVCTTRRIDALFDGLRPDRVPLVGLVVAGGGFSIVNCGFTLPELQTNPKKAFQAELWTHEQYEWDIFSLEPNHTVYGSWDFGAKMKMPEDEYSFSIIPISFGANNEEDVQTLQLPDPITAGAIPKRVEYARLLIELGLPIGFNSRSPFNMAADICPIEKFARWLMKKPALCERLMEIALVHTFNVLRYFVETFGAEKIRVGLSSPSESNQLFSPKLIEKYAIPYHREYHRRLRSLGIRKFIFHICGDQNLNLPNLSKFADSSDSWPHPSILSFGHEADLNEASKYFPEDIIQGNINPTVIQFGTPQEIYEKSRACIEKGKRIPGGFIFAPGCDLPPRAPSHNVWMMTKAIRDFGYYD